MTPEKLRVAREKLTRVFRYLEALNQHRNPAKRQVREQLWSFWLHDLPDHPSIKRGDTKSGPAKSKAAEFQNGDTSSRSEERRVGKECRGGGAEAQLELQ